MHTTALPGRFPVIRLAAVVAVAALIVAAAAWSRGLSPADELGWLKRLAAAGDSGAQLQLGLAYGDGRYGLAPNPAARLRWLTAAARGGNAFAADALANAYAEGRGTARDPQQALHWWRQAARAGNADAQARLGKALLAQGNDRQALSWLRESADRGDTDAQRDLTRLYRREPLPEADLHRGQNPISALAERLDARGLAAVLRVWDTIRTIAPVSPSLATLTARARRGDPTAEYRLGLRYRDGAWGVKRDPAKARLWLQRAAAAGNRHAAQALARTTTGADGVQPRLTNSM